MSATARAPRPDDDAPRGATWAPRAPRPVRTSTPRPATPRATTTGAAGPRPTTPRATPTADAPAEPVRGRAHSAPVRTGSLRTRPSRPVPREVPAAATAEPRRRSLPLTGRRAPFVLLVVGLLVGTTLALLFLNTAIAVNSLRETEQRAENVQRTQRLERLEQQVVSAGTPAALAAAAAAAGLVPAGTAGHLVIGPDGALVLRGTPVPAEAPPPGETPAPPAPPAAGTPPAPATPPAAGTGG
ncbi:hypothetical protein [Blastococcus sp. SYSU D00695]